MRVAAVLLLLASAPWAAAWDLDVDPSGGPLVLVDQVEAALADWSAAGADVEGTDRSVVVRYGDPELLGPDAIVFVVVRPDSGGFELLVHPEREGVRAALVPALGVVLGGAPGAGALDPRVDPGTPRVPSGADVAALRAARPEVPGDLDGDGRVDFEDLLLLAAAYGRQGINLPEDLDGDGVVGDTDLDLLRERYAFGPADDEGAAPAPSDAPIEDAPAEDAPTESAPTEDAPTEDAPGEDAPGEDPGPDGPEPSEESDAPDGAPADDLEPEQPDAPDEPNDAPD